METFLSFSSFGSLYTYLNIILVGAIVFWVTDRYTYLIDVIAYTLAKTFIPILTSFIFGSILGIDVSIGIGTILILLILYFILGLIVIKIIERIAAYYSSDTIIIFIIIFAIIDSIASWLFSLLISLFI